METAELRTLQDLLILSAGERPNKVWLREKAGKDIAEKRFGEMLEDWTRKKSVDELASVMSLGVDKVWLHKPSGDVLVPISEIEKGDELVVRTGSMIPLDSVVLSGEAAINQSSLTGESLPVHKTQGSYVYAGTVVEVA